MRDKISNYFEFKSLNTNFRKEILAGTTTFLAMAYILFVNPSILSLSSVEGLPEGVGMDPGAVFVATAISATIATFIMGIYAKYPIVLAPGMGINAFFAYTVVLGMGIPWETALAGTFVSGILFMLLTVSGIRENVINSIPKDLKLAMAAGIGLFVSFIGFRLSGIVVGTSSTFVTLGDLSNTNTLLSIFGLFIMVILMVKGINGAIFFGMLSTAILGIVIGSIDMPTQIVGAIPSLAPTFGEGIRNIGNIFNIDMLMVILTLLFIDVFDTAGTLVAIGSQAGLMKDGKLPRVEKALLADASATVVGSVLGTSTTVSYVESTAGVAVGGRSGFTAVVAGFCFLISLFFSPLLTVVTSAVTAPALILVGILMSSSLKDIDWKKLEIAIPAFFTVILMPLTHSIVTGIAIGFIFYPITMILKGRKSEVHPFMYGMAFTFILYLIFGVY